MKEGEREWKAAVGTWREGGGEEQGEKRCFSKAVKRCSFKPHLLFKKVFFSCFNCYPFS